MTQLPTLKSETFTPDGGLASWMLDAERGKKALAKARARRHLMDFIKYTFPEYDVNWHHEIICKYLERWAFGTGRWAIKRLMIFAPPGSGKALEINTPIPVPTGWKTINELNIGDEVFDENGQICHIIAKSPVWKNRDIYKVTVDRNHDEILADGNHIWKVHLWHNKDSSLHLTKDLSGRKSHIFSHHSEINHTIRVEPAGKGNTVCIQVDSPSGMFLCGKSMIPTHNSELVSRRLPAWILGRNPDVGIMATSYAASLAQDMNIDVQRIIDSELYSEVFPGTFLYGRNSRNSKPGENWSRNRNNFEPVGHKGYYKCAGVGGSITGKRFFYGIIDDPLRGRKDAESETIRNGIYNWYINDFFTRKLNTDARILITLTRWHEYDLAGRLLAMAKADPRAEQWTVVKFPLIAEDPIEPYDIRKIGDPLWVNRYGTSEEIESIKISAGTYVWSSLYQQRPTPPGGSIFNRGWWGDVTGSEGRNQFYNQDPQKIGKLCQHLILSADCTLKDTDGTDFVVVQIWGKESGKFYLLDQSRKRQDIIGTMQTIQTLSAKWPRVTAKLIEDTANGPAVIKLLKKEIPGLIPIPTRGESKTSRAIAVTPLIESGNVWLPHPKWAPWLHDFLEELASFPNGTHDDQVDCLSQSLNYLNTRTNFVLPKLPSRPIRMSGGWTG